LKVKDSTNNKKEYYSYDGIKF